MGGEWGGGGGPPPRPIFLGPPPVLFGGGFFLGFFFFPKKTPPGGQFPFPPGRSPPVAKRDRHIAGLPPWPMGRLIDHTPPFDSGGNWRRHTVNGSG